MSVFIPIPKKGSAKNCSSYQTISLTSQASKVTLNILQARFQKYLNRELPDVQLGLGKAEVPEIKLPSVICIYFNANRWGNNENCDRFSLLSYKITTDVDCNLQIRRHFLERRLQQT